MRLLVVEDDDRSAAYLKRGLSESGHVVDVAGDGELGLVLAMELIYDGLVVDRLLPKLDGIELVRRLREMKVNVPVIMVSALAGTVELTCSSRKKGASLSLIRSAGVRFHSTSVWLLFAAHGDGRMEYRGGEYKRDWQPGHAWTQNAGDVGAT